MKKFLILSYSFLFLVSCEVSQSNNIYIPPGTKTKPIENIFFYDDADALDSIKNKIKKTLTINQNNIISIKPEEISSFIECGFMNDEIYVDYINRIFNSSLTIEIIFKDRIIDKRSEMTSIIMEPYSHDFFLVEK